MPLWYLSVSVYVQVCVYDCVSSRVYGSALRVSVCGCVHARLCACMLLFVCGGGQYASVRASLFVGSCVCVCVCLCACLAGSVVEKSKNLTFHSRKLKENI